MEDTQTTYEAHSQVIYSLKNTKTMKSNLLRQVIIMSKRTFYGFLLQCILYGAIMAGNLNAQNFEKSIQEIYITIEVKNVPLKQVLNKIEHKTGFTFAYNSQKVDLKHKVSISFTNSDLATVLMQISKESDVKFKRINGYIHVGKRTGSESLQIEERIMMQETTITGRVISSEDNEGLPGVNVVVKGTSQGTVTDVEGNYKIDIPNETSVLSFSSVGFVDEEIIVGNQTIINISMVADISQLSEIVVTALGIEREKESLGYSASKIDGKDLAQSQAPNVANALSGKAAGVFITNPSSIEGGSTRITIRGNTSLSGGNQPLIIVDGLPFANDTDANSPTANRDYGSALNQIEAMDIERMDILKGTAASALYGSRGANGVIIITTKKGSGSKGMKVEYTFNTKVSKPYGYQDFQNEYGFGGPASILEGKPVLGSSHPDIWADNHGAVPAINPANNSPYNSWSYDLFSWFGTNSSWGPKFDDSMITWWDGEQRPWSAQPDNMKMYYRDGSTNTHNLSLMGGGEFGNFRASVTHKENKAIIDKSGFTSTNIFVGGTLILNKRLKAEVFSSFNRRELTNPPLLGQSNDAFTNMFYNLPRSYKGLEWTNYKNDDGSRNNQDGWGYWMNKHNGWNFNENEYKQYRNQMRSSMKLIFDPTDWLKLVGSAGIDFTSDERESKNGFTDGVGLVGGKYSHSLARISAPNFEFLATAHKDNLIDGLNGSISFGGQSWGTSRYFIEGNISTKGKSPYIYAFNNYETDPKANKARPKEERYEKRINSLFGFMDISYKNFIFLQVTARNDWSSTLPTDENSYFYPGASLSFVPSELFNTGNVLSFLKFRLAYAETGSDTDPYQVIPTFSPGSFGGKPTISMKDGLPNVNLKAQRSKEIEIGTNFAFFDSRLNIDLTYYNKNSFNQILSAPLPWSSGANSIKFNTGELELQGFEFDISVTAISNADWKWDIGFLGSKFSNKLLSLTEGVDIYNIGGLWGAFGTTMRATVGQNFGAIYGWGIQKDPNGRPILNVFKDTNGNVTGTLYKKSEEQEIVGNATPKLIGGVNSNLTWKNISLFTLVDFKMGGDVYSPQYGSSLIGGLSPVTLNERNGGGLPYTYPNGDTDNIGVVMDGVVLVEGTSDQYEENTNVVHAFYKYAGNGWNPNPQPDAVFENSWVKLREVTLSYRLPASLMDRVSFMENVDVSLIGRDLFYIWDTMPDNINPEGLNGVGDAQYVIAGALPRTRSFALNLRVTF